MEEKAKAHSEMAGGDSHHIMARGPNDRGRVRGQRHRHPLHRPMYPQSEASARGFGERLGDVDYLIIFHLVTMNSNS